MNSSTDHTVKKTPTLLGIAAAVVIVLVITGLLRGRLALQEPPPPKAPLTVSTVEYRMQDGYQREVSYLGLVVSSRKANLSFEIPGRIESLPYRQGSRVSKGQVIARLDDASLRARHEAASANLKRVRAELELARLKAQRQKDLRNTGAASKEAVDETRLRASALEALVEAMTAELSAIAIDLENSTLVAPYDGIVADHYVHEGTVVNAAVPVIRLVEIANLEAHVGVSATRAGTLESGKHYPLELRGSKVQARLLSVRPDVDPITRSATAVFALPSDVSPLDGEPITIRLVETLESRGGWLPMTALTEGQRGLWSVLRVKDRDGQSVVLREAVEVLEIQGDRVFVRGTLADGATVVAAGTHRVGPGARVSPVKAD